MDVERRRRDSARRHAHISRTYDRFDLMVPKGRKAEIVEYADKKGESVTGLVNRLIAAEMGYTVDQWRMKREKDGD
ncbi:MAG: hypothetical protein IKD01_04820 [Oscillospiraceae bacterium]|nr:hypothetical protein [Oscillospiraceae bacterium]